MSYTVNNRKQIILRNNFSTTYVEDVDESADTPITSTAIIRDISVSSTAGTDRFIRFYDKSTAATEVDTPFLEISLNADMNMNFPLNYMVNNGLSIRATAGAAVNNTTAPATSDVYVTISYSQ